MCFQTATYRSSSPSVIETEDKEAFRRVHSVKSSGENKIFSSQKVFRVVNEYAQFSCIAAA